MQPRTALIVAIVAGTLAVGLVAADLVWTLHVRIETHTETGWRTVATTEAQDDRFGYVPPAAFDCVVAGEEFRVVADNDKPFRDTLELRVRYFNGTAVREELLFEDTWSLAAFEVRDEVLTVPPGAAPSGPGREVSKGSVFIDLEERNLSVCVEEGP